MFILGLIVGLFVGAIIGFLVYCLCVVAHNSDVHIEAEKETDDRS